MPFPLDGGAFEYYRNIHKNWPVYNIIPFYGIYDTVIHTRQAGILRMLKELSVQVGGNILMFAPFGFLLPFLKKKFSGFKNMLIIAAVVSACIELLQLTMSIIIGACFRYADIDDVISNVLGALLGLLVFKLFNKVLHKVVNTNFDTLMKKEAETNSK